MSSSLSHPEADRRHVIVAGFGIPGRMVAENLHRRGVSYCVIELNPGTVERCSNRGVPIIAGDARNVDDLRRAGIERATLVAITLPEEPAALAAVEVVRRLNPRVRIIARCAYTSAGLEATRLGADQVIVAEQAVASAFSRLLDEQLP